MSWKEIKGLVQRQAGNRKYVLWFGPKDAKTVIIGEAPGDKEIEKGIPFVGPSGIILNKVLSELKIDRKNLYLTNAIKVRKSELRLSELPIWAKILREELKLIKPQNIIVLGAVAQRVMKLADVEGLLIPHPQYQRYIGFKKYLQIFKRLVKNIFRRK